MKPINLNLLLLLVLFWSCASVENNKFSASTELKLNLSLNESWMRYSAPAHLPKEYFLCQQGKIDDGMNYLKKLPATAIREREIAAIAECYFLDKNYSMANFYFKMGRSTYPDNPALTNNYALFLYQTNSPEVARDLLTQVIERFPLLRTPRYNRAVLYANFALYDMALEDLRILEEISPSDPILLQLKASIYSLSNRPKLAISYFSRIKNAADWHHHETLVLYAYALYQENRAKQAKEILGQAAKLSPSTNDPYRELRLFLQQNLEKV